MATTAELLREADLLGIKTAEGLPPLPGPTAHRSVLPDSVPQDVPFAGRILSGSGGQRILEPPGTPPLPGPQGSPFARVAPASATNGPGLARTSNDVAAGMDMGVDPPQGGPGGIDLASIAKYAPWLLGGGLGLAAGYAMNQGDDEEEQMR